jgi:hypothetical protein
MFTSYIIVKVDPLWGHPSGARPGGGFWIRDSFRNELRLLQCHVKNGSFARAKGNLEEFDNLG